jgi:hypothetical protein
MTLDTYADLFEEDVDEVADRLNAAIESTADALRTAYLALSRHKALSCSKGVELRGFEPLTFSMRTRRATNCAIAPDTGSTRYQPRPAGRKRRGYWPAACGRSN